MKYVLNVRKVNYAKMKAHAILVNVVIVFLLKQVMIVMESLLLGKVGFVQSTENVTMRGIQLAFLAKKETAQKDGHHVMMVVA